MSVRTESSGQTVTAYLEGEIDHHSAARIREKIEVDPKEPMYLKVVWGIGYKISK